MAVTSCFGVVYLLITVLSHWAPGLLRSDILGNETNWRQAVPEKKRQGELVLCTYENWEEINL